MLSFYSQVLNHFGAIDADLVAKQKYAVWKAGDIRLALKQGRRPTAGSPSDQTIGAHPFPLTPHPTYLSLPSCIDPPPPPPHTHTHTHSHPARPIHRCCEAEAVDATLNKSFVWCTAYRPGSKVLFALEPTDVPQPGTVAKAEIIGGASHVF